jgi:hypothetical protein
LCVCVFVCVIWQPHQLGCLGLRWAFASPKMCLNVMQISRLIVSKEVTPVYCVNPNPPHCGSQDSVGDITSDLPRAGQSGDRISTKKRFLLLQNRPDRLWSIFRFILNGYRPSFPGVKRPKHDADYLFPSSAKVKNEWSYNSTPPMCLHGEDRDTFTSFT